MKIARVGEQIFPVLILVSPVSAAEHPSFQDYWREATTCEGALTREYPDFTMVVREKGFTFYYFTKPSHPAFPGVIKRMLVQKDGAWLVQEDGHSYASDAGQPAFLAWLEQFKELDQRISGDIARQHSASPPNPN